MSKKKSYVSASSVGAVKRCPTLYCFNVKKVTTQRSKYSTNRGNEQHKQVSKESVSYNKGIFARLFAWILALFKGER